MVLVFNQHFQGEAWGSRVYSELSAQVLSAWLLELAFFQALGGWRRGSCLGGESSQSSGLGTFSA